MPETVLITGASGGIGQETARRFSAAGYSVALHCFRHCDAVLALCRELPNAISVCADLSDPQQATQMVETVQQAFGHIDVLVLNAGVAQQKLITHTTDDDWRHLFGVNVDGLFYSCRAALPDMINRKHGRIVTVSSIWGITGASCEVAYSASKGAVIAFSRALAKELGPSGITVNCVAPGVIQTDMLSALRKEDLEALREETPVGRLGTPADIASAIFYLSSPESGFLTGQVLSPNGGFLI